MEALEPSAVLASRKTRASEFALLLRRPEDSPLPGMERVCPTGEELNELLGMRDVR